MNDEIYERIACEALEKLYGLSVTGATFGRNYVAVATETGCGLAYITERAAEEAKNGSLERMAGKKASEIVRKYACGSELETCAALAVINSVLNVSGIPDDGKARKSITDGGRIAMVGYFSPIIEEVRNSAKELFIFELKNIKGVYHPADAADILPRCDGILITGATLANKTIHQYLPHIKPQTRVLIIGPSAPAAKALLEIASVAGGIVTDKDAAFKAAADGGKRNDNFITKTFWPQKTGYKISAGRLNVF